MACLTSHYVQGKMKDISSSEALHAISLPIILRHINQESEKLIEASNQENQLTVDPLEQQLFPTGGKIIAKVMCNYASSRCEIIEDYNPTCWELR